LRHSESCYVKEFLYLHRLDDTKYAKTLAEAKYPHYRLSVRIKPGHPLQIIFMPRSQFGMLLSGFGDEIHNVGLKLTGHNVNFAEHYFRHRWSHGTEILDDDGTFHHDKLKAISAKLKELGTTAKDHLIIN